jgi:D-alanyl-D-alanine carboxypeptidase
MLNFFASLIIASLLLPSGLNFLIASPVPAFFPFPEQETEQAPKRLINNNFGLQTSAKSILVVDDASGASLYQKNSFDVLPIASITKLITALTILETKPDWEKIVTISKEDQKEGGLIYFVPGEKVTVRDLFNLMLSASVNEAAYALARTSGLADFSSALNQKAETLAMADSYFIDPSGLDPRNVSSPRDLLKLAFVAFAQPEIVQALKLESYELKTVDNKRPIKAINTDKLLDSFLNQGEYKLLAAKTGYLEEAGYCLLVKIQKSGGPTLTLVLLGAQTISDRWQETKGLFDWVFRNYTWPDFKP